MAKNLKLKAARAEKDLTQGDLAAAVGYHGRRSMQSKKGSITRRSVCAEPSAGYWERRWMNYFGKRRKQNEHDIQVQ